MRGNGVADVKEKPSDEAFLLSLGDRLRRLEDPLDVLGEAAASLGGHLGVSRAGYAKVEADGDSFVVERDWTDGTVKAGTGRRSVASFGADVTAMLHRGETQRIEDARIDPRVRAQDRAAFEEMRIEAAVTVPLVKSGRLVAMFSVHKSSPRAWSDAEVRLIEEVAERTWAAHERARAEVGLTAEGRRRSFLLDMSDRLRGEADPVGVLGLAAQAIGEFVGARHVFFAELEEGTDHATVPSSWSDGTVPPRRGRYPVAMMGEAVMARYYAGDTIAVADAEAEPDLPESLRASFRAAGVRGYVTVPFMAAGRLMGTLSVQMAEPRAWTPADVELIEAAVERTWEAMQRARAHLALQESEATLAFLLALSDRTRHEADPNAVLAATARMLGEHLGVARLTYSEVDAAQATIRNVHAWGPGAAVAGTYPIGVLGTEVLDLHLGGRVFRSDDTLSDPRIEPHTRAVCAATGSASILTAPLVKNGRLVALLSVQDDKPRTWLDAEVRLIEEVAERTWANLERARTAARLADREATAAFLLDLGDRLRARTAAADILRDAVEAIGRHLAANRVGYAETDADADELAVDVEWGDGTLDPIAGRYPLSAFGRYHVAALGRGETARIDDVDASPHIDASNRPTIDAIGIRAAITVPLVRRGELVALLSVHHGAPRAWTEAEVRLVEEVAERTWAVVERARAEAELRESQALLEAFMANAPVGMYLKDEAGRYIMANAGMERIFGRPAAEAVGRTADELFEGEVLERIAEQDAVALAAGRAQVAEQHLPGTEDGSWTLVIRFPVDLGAQGRRIGGFAIDVSEQKRAEAKLAESEARLMAFLTHAPASMYLKDADGRYVVANADVARRLGVGQEALIGRTIAEVAPPEVAAYTEAREREVLEAGEPLTHEQAFQLAEGMVHALATRFPVPDADGRLTQVGGVLIDITAQKRAEAELERSREALYQSEKLTALGSLLAGLSHEMNNPLSVVVVQSVMMEEDAAGTALATRANKIRAAAERCSKIVQTFLAMARQKPPERAPVDLNAVVDAALELTAYGLRSTGIEVDRRLARGLPAIDADADQLHQVVANLVVNAQHALQEVDRARRLTVSTRPGRAPGTVEIEVADNGPGVPEDLRRRVFEPFFTTKPQGVGTGLGLSFSHGVVEAHGGRLELLDRGAGAAFLISLPTISGADGPEPAAATADEPAGPGRGHALVVDDEVDIADALAELLEREGYRVRVASSGAEAKRQLAARDFDLILSDLRMPDVDGPALHAWLSAERPHLLPRLGFVTGDTIGPNAVRFLDRAARPSLEKPFTPAALRAFVARVREGAA